TRSPTRLVPWARGFVLGWQSDHLPCHDMLDISVLCRREADPTDAERRARRSSQRSDGVKQRQVDLADRVREVREDFYGEHGAQCLADALGLPLRTWMNYERGVVIPAEVILKVIETTAVSPCWLLTGRGPKYE